MNMAFFVYKRRSYATSYSGSEHERSIHLSTDYKASRNTMKLKKSWLLKQWASRSADQWQMAARPWDINDLVSDHSNNELFGMTDLVQNQHFTRVFNTTVSKRIRCFKINNLDVYIQVRVLVTTYKYTIYIALSMWPPPLLIFKVLKNKRTLFNEMNNNYFIFHMVYKQVTLILFKIQNYL